MTIEDKHLEELVEHAVDRAMLDRERSLTLGRKDWFQMVGLLIMLLVQTVYVTNQWGELKAGIEANTASIAVKTEDRYTRTEALGNLNVMREQLSSLDRREAKLEELTSITLDKLIQLERALTRLEAVVRHTKQERP